MFEAPVSSCIRFFWHIFVLKSWKRNIPSAGSVDKRFATCAAEKSKPSKSSGTSSEISPTSNPKIIQVNRSSVVYHYQ